MVMVVSRDDLFADEIWNGINSENLKKYVSLIFKKHKFMRRGDAEENPKYCKAQGADDLRRHHSR